MLRKSIAWIVTLAMLVSLFPATAFAIPDLDNNRIPTATQAIYVDSEGNDESGNGSEAKPYATLAKAVSAVSEEAATIYVMSNLEKTESARFWNKHITITRVEVTAIVNRMLGRNGDSAYIDSNLSELKSFPDAPKNHWAFYIIMEATNSHTYHKEHGKESWTALKDE